MNELETWEKAYLMFETPEAEEAKFLRRLRALGIDALPQHLEVLELFSGRGGGLRAWEKLGFRNVEGLDLSPRLLAHYHGPFRCVTADACDLPYEDASKDIITIQGGLHHLPDLIALKTALSEARRVLRPDGRIVLVEPWEDGFLKFVHFVCGLKSARWLSPKIKALSEMIEHERVTYERWLGASSQIELLLRKYFEPKVFQIRWGKLSMVGTPRAKVS